MGGFARSPTTRNKTTRHNNNSSSFAWAQDESDSSPTIAVVDAEKGSWAPDRAYSNPPEYTYYTYKLLERRVADEVAIHVLSTFVVGEEAVAHGNDDAAQESGPQHGVGAPMGEEVDGPVVAPTDSAPARSMVHHIRRRRRRLVPDAEHDGQAL